MQKIPLTSYELIEQLAEQFPEVLYDTNEKHDEFLLKSGERRLVVYLMRCMENEISESREGRHY